MASFWIFFLAPVDLNLDKLNAEIASLETQRDKKIAKPTHEIESLEARLTRLRLRRTIALKTQQSKMDTEKRVEVVEQLLETLEQS